MAKKHRYTGDWPPPKVLQRIPNWEMAYDEEGMYGQDETTIRPQEEQTVITSDTVHTAGDVTLADGRTYPAIITVVSGPPESCSFHDGKRWRTIQKFRKKWEALVQTYLPEKKRQTPLDLKDKSTFPLRIRTQLLHQGGKQWQIEIRPNGSEKVWK